MTLERFEREGRIWFRNAVSETDLQKFDEAMAENSKAGVRIDPNEHLIDALSPTSPLTKTIRSLDATARAVRVVAFNKTEASNWGVPWHQDRIIAVDEKSDVPGFDNWTLKSGVWHCEPPSALLERMLFVRVHLDDTDLENGAMQIAVGSHKLGIVEASRAKQIANEFPIEICDAKRGDVLVLKMLTLHSSKPAQNISKRRVFRLDYASCDLPESLQWS